MAQHAIPPLDRTFMLRGHTLTAAGIARASTFVAALLFGIGAVAFYRHWGFVTDLWRMPDQAMSYRFMGSYVAAFAGSLLWVAITGQLAALAGIAVTVMAGGGALMAFYARLAWREDDRGFLLVALLMLGLVVVALAVFRWSRSLPDLALRQPRFARIAFVVFTLLLLLSTTRCLNHDAHIFPWELQPRWSSQIGLLLGASAVYFVYGLARGSWTQAGGQFAGFLFYDLVLAIPYARMASDRGNNANPYGFDPSYVGTGVSTAVNGPALAIVIAVISSSALIALWYLALARGTRLAIPGQIR